MTGAAAITILSLCLGAAPTPDFAAKLPAQVGTWRRSQAPRVYDRETLHDYIDGGAELYLAFDLVRALSFEYAAGADDEVKVDVFEMADARGAFGAFAHGRESVAAEVGQGSEYAGGLLTFWKDRYYVSILGFPETEARREAVHELGRAIAALIPGTGEPPAILGALPSRGLVKASARTFHHPILQNDYATVSHDNELGIGPRAEAVLARYQRDGARHVLLLVEHAAPADAEKAERAFVAGVLGGAKVARKGEGWAGLRRIGNRLYVVLDAPSRRAAEQVLAEAPGGRN
jgi:hypothetical protein